MNSKYKEWTSTEIDLLSRIYPSCNLPELLNTFPERTRGSINCKVYQLGLKKRRDDPEIRHHWSATMMATLPHPKVAAKYHAGRVGHTTIDFTFSSTEAAYLAGLLDGDGYISIRLAPQKGRLATYHIVKSVGYSNTDKPMMEWISQRLDVPLKADGYTSKHKTVYEISFHGYDSIIALLKPLLPYLIAKRERADLMVQLCESRINTLASALTERGRYTEHEITLASTIQELVHNHGHPNKATYSVSSYRTQLNTS